MAQMDNVLVVLITFLVQSFFNFIIVLVAAFRYFERKRINNLDITILDLTRNGVVGRHEIGRIEKTANKGFRIVTVTRFGIRKIKDDLGYHLGDDDMFHSSHGRKRKFLVVAKKDNLAAPLETIEVGEDWDKKEIELLQKAYEKIKSPRAVDFSKVPKTLNLVPINKEQIRFAVDVAKDIVEVEGSDERKMAKRMVLIAAGIFVLALIMSLVIFIVVLNQSPNVAAQVAGNAVDSAVTNVGGIVG